MKIRMHFAYGWHTNAKDVECMRDAIRRFRPHIVLGESAYMPREAKIGLERRYEDARRRRDPIEVRRMFGGAAGTTTLSGSKIDVSRPIIELCVEKGIRFMYDESWSDTRQAVRKVSENQEMGKKIQRAIFLFLNGRAREAIEEYRTAIRQRIAGSLERDENSSIVVRELVPVLPHLNGITGLDEVRILNRVGLYHLRRFERLKVDGRVELSCSFETTPPTFGRLGAIMARSGLELETDLSDETIMRVMAGDLLINYLNPMVTWSPLFVAIGNILTDKLEGDRLSEFGVRCKIIKDAFERVQEPIRTVFLMKTLSELFGVELSLDEEQMHRIIRDSIPGFSAERTEFDGKTDLREIMRKGSGRIIE